MFRFIAVSVLESTSLFALNCSKTNAPESSDLIKFSFVAVNISDPGVRYPFFNSEFSDTLSGTFSYLALTKDYENLGSQPGLYYNLQAPAKMTFVLDSLEYESTSNFDIMVYIKFSDLEGTGNHFQISSFDTGKAAKRFGVDNFSEILILQDTTSKTFQNEYLPSTLNLSAFTYAWIFVNFAQTTANYSFKFKIIKLTKIK